MTHYDTLGILKDANNDDIRKAYFKLMKENHPDKVDKDKLTQKLMTQLKRSPTADEVKAAITNKVQEIVAAYEVLSDAEKRAEYDRGNSSFFFNKAAPASASSSLHVRSFQQSSHVNEDTWKAIAELITKLNAVNLLECQDNNLKQWMDKLEQNSFTAISVLTNLERVTRKVMTAITSLKNTGQLEATLINVDMLIQMMLKLQFQGFLFNSRFCAALCQTNEAVLSTIGKILLNEIDILETAQKTEQKSFFSKKFSSVDAQSLKALCEIRDDMLNNGVSWYAFIQNLDTINISKGDIAWAINR